MNNPLCVIYYFMTDEFDWKDRLVYLIFFATMTCLALPTYLYDFLNKSMWDRYVVTTTASLTFAMLVVTHLAHMLPRSKPKITTAPTPPAAAEKLREKPDC